MIDSLNVLASWATKLFTDLFFSSHSLLFSSNRWVIIFMHVLTSIHNFPFQWHTNTCVNVSRSTAIWIMPKYDFIEWNETCVHLFMKKIIFLMSFNDLLMLVSVSAGAVKVYIHLYVCDPYYTSESVISVSMIFSIDFTAATTTVVAVCPAKLFITLCDNERSQHYANKQTIGGVW